VVVTDADTALVDSSQAAQMPQTETGFHYTLNLELLGQYQLAVQMVDAHGLPGSTERDLALGGAGYTSIEIGDDIRLDWLSGTVVTALEGEQGVELSGNGSYLLEFSGEGIICRFENGNWRALAPEGVQQIVIHEGGHYALRSAGDLLPDAVTLYDNYPNPFNGSTRLEFTLPERAAIQLSVYNLLGRRVEVLQESTLNAGFHQYDWQPGNYASGMYWAVLRVTGETESVTRIQKMLYLK